MNTETIFARSAYSRHGETVLAKWIVSKIVHFDAEDFVKDGLTHFGFHDKNGNHYAISHQKHFLGLIEDGKLKWTVAASQVSEHVPNITAKLDFPMYVDNFQDGTLIVSDFGDARLVRVDTDKKRAELFVEGGKFGMRDAGNCVVDDEDTVWVNEVVGCKIWRFDSAGKPILTLGDGAPGFQSGTVDFKNVRFSWIYDIRRGPEGNIYVLDSKNFAVRMIDQKRCEVRTLAGNGKPGFEGDGGHASNATFGGNAEAKFDGPISLSIDEDGNIFVGDRQNHVVRIIHAKTNIIETIAGKLIAEKGKGNHLGETDPLKLNLPEISSMDYYNGCLFVPTDITPEEGDLALLVRRRH